MDDIIFKPLTRADESFLWEMLYLALFVPAGHAPLPPESIHSPELRRYVQDWGKPADEGFLALDGEKPVGAVWIRLMTGENRGYGYVDDQIPELSMAVLPEYRGKGIGKDLMLRLFSSLKTRYAAVCLSVSVENPASRLYRRMGFRVFENDGSSLKMIRWLN